jgi:hypothetical protein
MIIGTGHVARAGKDTAAEGLIRDLGYQRMSFAAPLKELALKADPLITSATRTVNTQAGHGRLKWTVQGLGGWDAAKDTYPEVRKFLQNLGLGAREVFGEDFWVDMALKQAERYENVVFTDVRFINEADAIKAAGGKVVRIDRPGFVAAGHVSETELLGYDFDHVIVNDGTVVDLQLKLVDYAKSQSKALAK